MLTTMFDDNDIDHNHFDEDHVDYFDDNDNDELTILTKMLMMVMKTISLRTMLMTMSMTTRWLRAAPLVGRSRVRGRVGAGH